MADDARTHARARIVFALTRDDLADTDLAEQVADRILDDVFPQASWFPAWPREDPTTPMRFLTVSSVREPTP